MGRRRGLHDAALARAAGILRTAGDNYAELRRNNIQPLANVFTDDMSFMATATQCALGFDHFFDAGQMLRQRTSIDLAWTRLATDLP